MAHAKKSDIEMIEEQGRFFLAIGDHCVTKDYKTADDCYKAYILELINGIERAASYMPRNTGF